MLLTNLSIGVVLAIYYELQIQITTSSITSYNLEGKVTTSHVRGSLIQTLVWSLEFVIHSKSWAPQKLTTESVLLNYQ